VCVRPDVRAREYRVQSSTMFTTALCSQQHYVHNSTIKREITVNSLRTALSVVVIAVSLIAAPPVIGTVTAGGAFRLNGDTVIANGTLTEGAVIETGSSSSSVQLAGGARLSLSAESRGKLYSDRIILEKGETRLDNGVGFHLEALGLTIRPDRALSTARIGFLENDRVRVAALTGSFRVLNARGVLVANIAAGSALAFKPLSVAAVTHITGTLSAQSGHFLLTDRLTHVTVEVTGQGLRAQLGQVVHVTGTFNAAATPISGASQVIVATQVQAAGASRGGTFAGGAAAAGAGGAASGAGHGAATIAALGGIAAVASLGGFAASEALFGQSQSPPFGVPPGPPVTPPGRPPIISPPGRPPGRPPVNPPGLSR